MDRTETQRLAGAINQLRPDWPTKSLVTFIETQLHERSYRDAAAALAYVATDAATRTPRRVLENGPWWTATPGGVPIPRNATSTTACRICGNARPRCEQIAALADDGHAYTPLVREPGVGFVNPDSGELLTSPARVTTPTEGAADASD